MSEISFTCPGCQQTLEAPDEMAGEVVECPGCQQQMTVPQPEQPEKPEPQPEPQPEKLYIGENGPISEADAIANQGEGSGKASNNCPECGEKMEPGSVLCVKCGFHTKLGKKIDTDLS